MSINSTTTYPMEPKVKIQAAVSYILGVVIVAVLGAVNQSNLIGELPDYVSMFLAPLLPTVIGLGTAFAAKHQWRTGEVVSNEAA